MLFIGPVYHRELLWSLIKRDFIGRYKGSILGVSWSLFSPLLLLAMYTIVFSIAFQARWGAGDESKVTFAVILFSGMIVHGFFAECLNRAPMLITGHPNYVKKVVFPLEILPWVILGSAVLHFIVSMGVLLAFCALIRLQVHAATVLIPLLILPLMLQSLGLVYLLASVGVYLRDLVHGISMLTTIALFMAPVFYPIDALPTTFRWAIALNPITLPILQVRDAMLWGAALNWRAWFVSLALGIACNGRR